MCNDSTSSSLVLKLWRKSWSQRSVHQLSSCDDGQTIQSVLRYDDDVFACFIHDEEKKSDNFLSPSFISAALPTAASTQTFKLTLTRKRY